MQNIPQRSACYVSMPGRTMYAEWRGLCDRQQPRIDTPVLLQNEDGQRSTFAKVDTLSTKGSLVYFALFGA